MPPPPPPTREYLLKNSPYFFVLGGGERGGGGGVYFLRSIQPGNIPHQIIFQGGGGGYMFLENYLQIGELDACMLPLSLCLLPGSASIILWIALCHYFMYMVICIFISSVLCVFQGLVGLVTGGASGLGRGAVERFVRNGAKVIICDLPNSPGEQVAGELGRENCVFVPTDVSNWDMIICSKVSMIICELI